jgi:putative ABC transport system permease protein
VLVGVCKASPPFQTMPVLYTRYHQALAFAPPERHRLSFVLARPEPGVPAEVVCERIQGQTGLQALTGEQFARRTIVYYFRNTGIPLNFVLVVTIGFIVGVAIVGQTFYLFTVENLRQFGVLKAMGVSNRRIVGMILLQALVVGLLGFGLGVGLAALLIETLTHNVHHLAGFFLPWQVLLGVGAAVLVIVTLSSLLSIRRVLVLEPMIVFRG